MGNESHGVESRMSEYPAIERRRPAIESIADLAELVGAPTRVATEVQILRDGEGTFPAMLELIDAARSEVLFENFIFAGDETGKRFADVLYNATRRGVHVRVLYDPVGTMMVRGGSIADTLIEKGVPTRAFNPPALLDPRTWGRVRHRDHRKTLTIDGEASVVGGLCISNNWAPAHRGGAGWRDTALLVRGPIAADVKRAFDAMWKRSDGSEVPVYPESDEILAPPAALVVADRPGMQHVANLYAAMADRARRSFEITDAYLVLQKSAQASFCAAARRGVSVRMLLPGRNNHPLAGAASRRGYESLLQAGVEIWEWDGAMIHAKTAVMDGDVTLVGSSNLDPLSMHRNYELNLLVADPDTGARMQDMFERDLTTASQIQLTTWRRRPGWQRLAESIGALFGSSL
jgi:cardiolipin synthase